MKKNFIISLLIFFTTNVNAQEMGLVVKSIGPESQEVLVLYIMPTYMDSCLNCEYPNVAWNLSTSINNRNFDILAYEFKNVIKTVDYVNLKPEEYQFGVTSFAFYNMTGEQVSEYIINSQGELTEFITLLAIACEKWNKFDYKGLFSYFIMRYADLEKK